MAEETLSLLHPPPAYLYSLSQTEFPWWGVDMSPKG